MAKYVMALDAGTTSNRCILFNEKGEMCSVAQKEFTQFFPKPGWVEHDADEIWATQYEVAKQAMENVGATAADIAAIGITNQRETTIVWDKATGEPVHHAIVWQCRRTAEYCDSLKDKGLVDKIREKTGLVIDAYFSGTKIHWILENVPGARERAEKVKAVLQNEDSEIANAIKKDEGFLVKRSQWIFGGDGWAYDIGYGGLDHVLASNEDVNVLVFDTEIYSNTGGQASKSTPTAAVAKFAAAGKRIRKKDLGLMAITYGYVYVAQVCLGADMNQTVKAIAEAESYKGPSLIIAYAPCISHGIISGMSNTPGEQKKAVACGYWQLYRYNPDVVGEKPAFTLDSKAPNYDLFNDFLMGEVRYSALAKVYPELAEELFARTKEDAIRRYGMYKKLSEIN